MNPSKGVGRAEAGVISNQKPDAEQATLRKIVCNLCSRPSGSIVCAACGDRVRAEAFAGKRREDSRVSGRHNRDGQSVSCVARSEQRGFRGTTAPTSASW